MEGGRRGGEGVDSLSQILDFRRASGRGSRGNRNTLRCQRCLEYGHWTYECKKEPKYICRPSRTATLRNPRLEEEIRLRVRGDQHKQETRKGPKNDYSDEDGDSPESRLSSTASSSISTDSSPLSSASSSPVRRRRRRSSSEGSESV